MVHQIVSRLVRRYGTRDPFEIARLRHIILITEPLGSIRGYYSCSYRHQVIHLNSNLEENQLRFTCAHELGHAILHPKANTPFLRQNTLFPISRYEWEASRFAACSSTTAPWRNTTAAPSLNWPRPSGSALS